MSRQLLVPTFLSKLSIFPSIIRISDGIYANMLLLSSNNENSYFIIYLAVTSSLRGAFSLTLMTDYSMEALWRGVEFNCIIRFNYKNQFVYSPRH